MGIGARKRLFFSAQTQSGKARSRFVFPYTNDTLRPVAGLMLAKGLLEDKCSNHSTKCKGDRWAYLQETHRKYAGPFTGIVTLAC